MRDVEYNAVVGVDAELTDEQIEGVLEALSPYGCAVGAGAAGGYEVTITVNEPNLAQASSWALAHVMTALKVSGINLDPARIEVLPTSEYDAR